MKYAVGESTRVYWPRVAVERWIVFKRLKLRGCKAEHPAFEDLHNIDVNAGPARLFGEQTQTPLRASFAIAVQVVGPNRRKMRPLEDEDPMATSEDIPVSTYRMISSRC